MQPCPAGHLIAFYGFKISVASHLLQGAACYAFELNKQREGGLLFFSLVSLSCVLAVLFCIFSRRHFAIKTSDYRIHASPTKKEIKRERGGKGGGRGREKEKEKTSHVCRGQFFLLCGEVKNSFAGRPSWPMVGIAASVGTAPLVSLRKAHWDPDGSPSGGWFLGRESEERTWVRGSAFFPARRVSAPFVAAAAP